MSSAISLMCAAFVEASDMPNQNPARTVFNPRDVLGVLAFMPASSATSGIFGVKVVTVFSGNPDRGLSTHQGHIFLYDRNDGHPLAAVDATSITEIRTAASTALATQLLSNPHSTTLGIIGTGRQAIAHAIAICSIRSISKILVTGRTLIKSEMIACEIENATGIFCRSADMKDVVACQILTTLTDSDKPLFSHQDIAAGSHVNLVGASAPHLCEAPPELFLNAKWFLDSYNNFHSLSGELRLAKQLHIDPHAAVRGTVGDVISGKAQGRQSAEDRTVFRSFGLGIQDILASYFVFENCAGKYQSI